MLAFVVGLYWWAFKDGRVKATIGLGKAITALGGL